MEGYLFPLKDGGEIKFEYRAPGSNTILAHGTNIRELFDILFQKVSFELDKEGKEKEPRKEIIDLFFYMSKVRKILDDKFSGPDLKL